MVGWLATASYTWLSSACVNLDKLEISCAATFVKLKSWQFKVVITVLKEAAMGVLL